MNPELISQDLRQILQNNKNFLHAKLSKIIDRIDSRLAFNSEIPEINTLQPGTAFTFNRQDFTNSLKQALETYKNSSLSEQELFKLATELYAKTICSNNSNFDLLRAQELAQGIIKKTWLSYPGSENPSSPTFQATFDAITAFNDEIIILLNRIEIAIGELIEIAKAYNIDIDLSNLDFSSLSIPELNAKIAEIEEEIDDVMEEYEEIRNQEEEIQSEEFFQTQEQEMAEQEAKVAEDQAISMEQIEEEQAEEEGKVSTPNISKP